MNNNKIIIYEETLVRFLIQAYLRGAWNEADARTDGTTHDKISLSESYAKETADWITKNLTLEARIEYTTKVGP